MKHAVVPRSGGYGSPRRTREPIPIRRLLLMVKVCSKSRCLLTLSLVVGLGLGGPALASSGGAMQDNSPTLISLRWGARPGVSRYRLQLASDADFRDIVFDRVVNGTEYRISDL